MTYFLSFQDLNQQYKKKGFIMMTYIPRNNNDKKIVLAEKGKRDEFNVGIL